MARNRLPLIAIATLGGMTASLGLGYGFGQYTVSGINPFYAAASSARYDGYRSASRTADTFDPTRAIGADDGL